MGCGKSKEADDNRSLKELLNDPKALAKIKENAKAQFLQSDKDKSMALDANEFADSCISYNRKHGFPEPTKQQIEDAMKEFDINGDKKLSLEEYQNMIISVLKIMASLE